MKVYVVTKAKIMEPEMYVAVVASKKQAEKIIRQKFPNAKMDEVRKGVTAFECHDANKKVSLMFIHEEEI